MESDYYGDATIETTPRPTPAPEARRPTQKPHLRPNPLLSDRLPEAPDLASQNRPTDPTKTRAGRIGAGRRQGRIQQEPKLRTPQDTVDDEEEDEEEEFIPRSQVLGHERSADTPIPKRLGLTSTRESRARETRLRDDPEVGSSSRDQNESPMMAKAHLARVQTLSTVQTRPSQPSLRITGARTEAPDPRKVTKAFEQAQDSLKAIRATQQSREPATTRGLGGGRRLGTRDEASGVREDSDAAIQRQIREAEEQAVREHRALEAQRQGSLQRLAWLWSWFPWDGIRTHLRHQQRARHDNDDDLDEDEQNLAINWWQLLNPLTYIRELVWLFDKIMDHVVNLNLFDSANETRRRIPGPGNTFLWILLGMFGSVIGILTVLAIMPPLSPQVPPMNFPGGVYSPTLPSLKWPSLGGLTSKIGGIIPSFSWPSSKDDLEGLWESDDDNSAKAEPYLKRYGQELNILKSSGKLHKNAIDRLEKIMPKIIHMDLKDGKPVIAQDFWHALRDLIHKDGGILTLDKKGKFYELTSEQQWQAIAKRVVGDSLLTSKLNMTAADIERRLADRMPGFWDSWVKKNDDKIAEILGPALNKIQASGSGREFDKRFSKMVKDLLQGNELKQVVVTREEFIHQLKNDFATHRSEIRAELNELQPKLEDLIRESVKVATQTAPEGISKEEVKALVDARVRKAIADMNLEAMAKGKIHVHWDAELKNQVNFFAVGSGATIDGELTSPTYDPKKKGVITDEDYKKGIRGVKPFPALAALTAWEDEGDCWCAARALNRRGNPYGATLSVQLGHSIIPQHIVIEHILSGATTDPGARPRNIEIWAKYEDEDLHNKVLDFSAVTVPDDTDNWNFTAPEYGDEFVKIGQFVYEDAELHDGVLVHHLNTQLATLAAATDQVVIRAVSNYGAEKYTCFYRVRVFGELVGLQP